MAKMAHSGFENSCLISCGMLHPEISHLMENGFLKPRQILFTPPGLHALPERLEEHLLKKLEQAQGWCSDNEIIVVYGKKCHVSADEPLKRVDSILQERDQGIIRDKGIMATICWLALRIVSASALAGKTKFSGLHRVG